MCRQASQTGNLCTRLLTNFRHNPVKTSTLFLTTNKQHLGGPDDTIKSIQDYVRSITRRPTCACTKRKSHLYVQRLPAAKQEAHRLLVSYIGVSHARGAAVAYNPALPNRPPRSSSALYHKTQQVFRGDFSRPRVIPLLASPQPFSTPLKKDVQRSSLYYCVTFSSLRGLG